LPQGYEAVLASGERRFQAEKVSGEGFIGGCMNGGSRMPGPRKIDFGTADHAGCIGSDFCLYT
jgi:hypothetical protein